MTTTTTFGPIDEAVYYTLLLMPPNGDNQQPFGYDAQDILNFWLSHVGSDTILTQHSVGVHLTLLETQNSLTFGSARAIFRVVGFNADGVTQRFVVNQILRQIPVPSMRFLVSIGVFDKEIAAQRATCRVVSSTYEPAPALPSSVLPPKQPFNGTLEVVVPASGIVGACPTAVQVDVVQTSLALNANGTCEAEVV